MTRNGFASEDEEIALAQENSFLAGRQRCHPPLAGRIAAHINAQQDGLRGYVRGLLASSPSRGPCGSDYFENPALAARILEMDSLSGFDFGEPIRIDRQYGIRVGRRAARRIGRRDPDARRMDDLSHDVAAGMPHDDLGTRFERAGAKLRTGEVYQDAAFASEFAAGSTEMFDHREPYVRRVVRA